MNNIHYYVSFSHLGQVKCIIHYMNIREEVKIMLFAKQMTITELARKMTEKIGKNYTQSLISHKLADESLKYKEMKIICEILGYKIHIDLL